jgi:CheY-like chemotaxis protein
MVEEKEVRILHVDDTEMDRFIVKRALEKSTLNNRLFVCEDGEQALDFLYHRAKYTSQEEYPRPDIILLDLNMPKIDGIGVLKQTALKKIAAVVMLTGSGSEEIAVQALHKGAIDNIPKDSLSGYKIRGWICEKCQTVDSGVKDKCPYCGSRTSEVDVIEVSEQSPLSICISIKASSLLRSRAFCKAASSSPSVFTAQPQPPLKINGNLEYFHI